MNKIIVFVFVVFVPLCKLCAQMNVCCQEKYVQKNYLHVSNQIIYSFCDSLVTHSKNCLSSPSWYKLKFHKNDNDTTEVKIWCFMVQCLDSSYYCVNKGWLAESEFSICKYSIGVFSYKDLLFEVITEPSLQIEQFFTSLDSLVQVQLWDSTASPVMISRKIEFPEYFQMSGIINLSRNEITVCQDICSCNWTKTKRNKNKRVGI